MSANTEPTTVRKLSASAHDMKGSASSGDVLASSAEPVEPRLKKPTNLPVDQASDGSDATWLSTARGEDVGPCQVIDAHLEPAYSSRRHAVTVH